MKNIDFQKMLKAFPNNLELKLGNNQYYKKQENEIDLDQVASGGDVPENEKLVFWFSE